MGWDGMMKRLEASSARVSRIKMLFSALESVIIVLVLFCIRLDWSIKRPLTLRAHDSVILYIDPRFHRGCSSSSSFPIQELGSFAPA